MHYENLNLAQITADLDETLFDLCANAGKDHLLPLHHQIRAVKIVDDRRPSQHLVALMENLLEYGADQLNPRAEEMMKAAVIEICRLAE